MRELAICESAIALLELVADSSASASAFALAILALALALLPFALSSVVTTLLHALLLSPTAILATLGRVGKALVIPELLIPSRVEEVLRTIRAIDGDIFPLLFLRRRRCRSLLLGCHLRWLLDLLLFLFFLRDLLLLCLLLLCGRLLLSLFLVLFRFLWRLLFCCLLGLGLLLDHFLLLVLFGLLHRRLRCHFLLLGHLLNNLLGALHHG
mmetsp:Transcript_72324/g.190693  ORF Transcript_72324/g.190693 Transcript_72324/m.190693 type:complete len:210 (+) Transcript_72324:251-880(+)